MANNAKATAQTKATEQPVQDTPLSTNTVTNESPAVLDVPPVEKVQDTVTSGFIAKEGKVEEALAELTTTTTDDSSAQETAVEEASTLEVEITQEHLDDNPGLEEHVQVGDIVTINKEATFEDLLLTEIEATKQAYPSHTVTTKEVDGKLIVFVIHNSTPERVYPETRILDTLQRSEEKVYRMGPHICITGTSLEVLEALQTLED